jgi:dCTP deaminase
MPSARAPSGILPSQWIRAAATSGIIQTSTPLTSGQIQPNSLDVRISNVGWRVRCSFLPGSRHLLEDRLKQLEDYGVLLDDQEGRVLEPNQVFVFRLCERIRLPPDISVTANPKSSTGRLDVFTRLVGDRARSFDFLPAGYEGPLYVEIVPRSFAIRVRPGDSFAQIRFQRGKAALSDEETRVVLEQQPLIFSADGRPVPAASVHLRDGIHLSVRTKGDVKTGETIGYQARKHTPPIDLRAIGTAAVGKYWRYLRAHPTEPLILEPDEFYILASNELVSIPPEYCAEMVPFDPRSGELRTHYAGFFDSGFGHFEDPTAAQGAAVVLEVRSRDVPFVVDHGQRIFRLVLLRNTEVPDLLYGRGARSHYQGQRLKLGKQFTSSGRTAEPPGSQGALW